MKIIKFNEKYNTTLIQPSDEEIEEAEKFLEKGVDPSWDLEKFGNFYIDVSGKYSVYYTLWKYKPGGFRAMPSCTYICNLSTDFKKACEKAKKAAGRCPIMIDKYGTKMGLWKKETSDVMIKGKYRGWTLGEIFVENPKYINWLYNQLFGYITGDVMYTDNNKERKEKIKYYNDLYWETITNKNKETSKSEYIGNIDEKIEHTATVYFVEKTDGLYGEQWKCKLIDDDENRFIVYSKKEVEKNDEIKFTAKVKKHEEKVGIKYTFLYWFKILNIRNIVKTSDKYNI